MVRYNPCTAFFLLLHFFDNCKYSATFWQKCRLKLRKESFLVIIFLSRFFYRKRSPVMKTKELLADSFRSLVLTMPFQKISIKMITDGAHVIRLLSITIFRINTKWLSFCSTRTSAAKSKSWLKTIWNRKPSSWCLSVLKKIRNTIIDFLKPQARIASENFFHTTVNRPFSGFCPDILWGKCPANLSHRSHWHIIMPSY